MWIVLGGTLSVGEEFVPSNFLSLIADAEDHCLCKKDALDESPIFLIIYMDDVLLSS